MTSSHRIPGLVAVIGALMLGAGWAALDAMSPPFIASGAVTADTAELRATLEQAQRAAEQAGRRAEELEADADDASETAQATAQRAAALAARIQQAEADVAAAQARYALITDQRQALDAQLAEKQQPLVQLTGALQNMARRPILLSALQPGSLKDTVYVRATLETTLPHIREQTASLRSELEQGRELEREARDTLASLRASERDLIERRQALAALAAEQDLASREARALAQRENQRALALSETARDLDEFVGEMGRIGALRAELAALPGPLLRPPRPTASQVMPATLNQEGPQAADRPAFQLPVFGRTILGFGEVDASGLSSTGIQLAPQPGSQITAPGAGRIAFAGPYQGFGRIVIIEHGDGWTSLVTGLARVDVEPGDDVIAGSPLGAASTREPKIGLEVRDGGAPVNPLDLF